jgi:eyes absent family protein 2
MGEKTNVYIWDMDETLILLKSLITGTYAEPFNGIKDIQKGIQIGKTWENHILQVCDDYFFYEQIENCNKPFLDAMTQYDDGQDLSNYNFSEDGFGPLDDDVNKKKLAYRHRAIAAKYKKGLFSVFNEDMMKFWNDLYDATDKYTDRWLSSARACLEEISRGDKVQNVNILVTSGSLIPSLVKGLLFRLDDFIPVENVYSSWEVGKPQCFSYIKERFTDPNVRFCVIGDGWEECEAAQIMKWPFVQIDPKPAGPHRFPGLNLKTLAHYFSVVYGTEEDDDVGASH